LAPEVRQRVGLALEGVAVNYGVRRVLEDCSLQVDDGELVTLVGHNGAGKTTLLRAAAGLVPLLSGTVHMGEQVFRHQTCAQRARAGLALVPDAASGPVFGALSVRENLMLAGDTASSGVEVSHDQIRALFPAIFERMNRPVASLSGGQRQMVAIAMALLRRPHFLMLDEPSVGLAPVLVEQVMEAIRSINHELGVGVLVVEQNVRAALKESDRIAVLKNGRIEHEFHPSEIQDIHQLWQYF
jgi:branched-chain amino acid transport system ATP-binding protein